MRKISLKHMNMGTAISACGEIGSKWLICSSITNSMSDLCEQSDVEKGYSWYRGWEKFMNKC